MERISLASSSITKQLSTYTSTAFTFVSAVLHYVMYTVSLQFADVFAGFEAELPVLTQLLIHPVYYWLIPILSGVAFFVHRLGFITKKQTVLLGTGLTLGSIPLCIIGFYLPIFQLGSVVTG